MLIDKVSVIISEKLKEIFNAKDVDYYGQSWQTDNHTFFLKCEKIDAVINEKWSKTFPSGSYFSIAKRSVSPDYLNMTIDVTPIDAEQFKEIIV